MPLLQQRESVLEPIKKKWEGLLLDPFIHYLVYVFAPYSFVSNKLLNPEPCNSLRTLVKAGFTCENSQWGEFNDHSMLNWDK